MSGVTRLFANLGAEEPDAWLGMSGHPRVRTAARLWASLFPASATPCGPGASSAPRLAGALARDGELPAFPFCAPGEVLVPWLATDEAELLARSEGVPFAAAPAAIVRRVHDKAFAHRVARASALVPSALEAAALVFEPGELVDADAVRCRIEAELASWPLALRARFVVKPRLGTSGRGRIDGASGRIDATRLAGALERLRACGGALVEPWLERTLDLSAQLFVAGPDDVRVLGTLRQVLTRNGGPTGHAGRIDRAGRVDSGTTWDAPLRAAACVLGAEAARAGFTGACGLDAFVFRAEDGSEILRPVVELNARYTMGTVAIGLVTRAFRAGLVHGEAAFYLGFPPEAREWPVDAGHRVASWPLLDDDPAARLCLAADERALAEVLPPARRTA